MATKNFNMTFDPVVKEQFAEVLAEYGLTVPQAFKLFANQVIKTRTVPLNFDWQVRPNRETLEALQELRSGGGENLNVELLIEEFNRDKQQSKARLPYEQEFL